MKLSKVILFHIIFFAVSFIHFSFLAANEILIEKDITIGFNPNNPPLSMVLPNGRATGLHVEYWRLWAKANNLTVTFVSTELSTAGNLPESIDFFADVYHNQSYYNPANLSLPIHQVKTGAFYLAELDNVPAIKELSHVKIGIKKDATNDETLKQKFPNVKIVIFEQTDEMVHALLERKIFLFIDEVPDVYNQLGKMGLIGAVKLSNETIERNDVRALVQSGKPEILNLINSGILKIPLSELIELEKSWLPGIEPYYDVSTGSWLSTLNLEQRDWLKNNSSFSLGVDPSWEPFDYINDEGEHSGISSEYISLVSSKLKIETKLHRGLSWAQVINKAKLGEIDILPAVTITDERKEFLEFSKPYLSFPMVIVTHKDAFLIQNLSELQDKKIGVIKSSPTEEFLRNENSEFELELYSTTKEGLLELSNGKIDAFVQNLAVVTHQLNTNNLNKLKVAAILPEKFEVAIAVRKNLKQIIPMINQALESIDSKQRSAITNNWLALKVTVGTDIKTYLLWSVPIATVLVFIILFVSRSNRRLQFEISERRKVERHLEVAKEKAESANVAKGEFLANMSHEIRTPMNAVVGMSLLLDESGLSKEQQNYNHILSNSASSLLVLIDDILDLSKVEAGKLKLDIAPLSVVNVVDNICAQIALSIDANRIKLSSKISKKIPKLLLGDSVRLGQILLNLLNNASKFTTQGEIKISAELVSQDLDEVTVEFVISDTGIGMNQEQQKKIFATYSQADSSITRRFGGTGLGLAICKNLCSVMNGKIWVVSEQNKGSEFHFTVVFGVLTNNPVNRSDNSLGDISCVTKKSNPFLQQSNQSNNVYSKLSGKRVLLVDDNQVNLMIAQKILTKFGLKISLANNGQEAIEKIEKSSFDIVLMDIQMPVMDGLTATKHLRENPKYKMLPIIAMSANVLPSDIDKVHQAGMNGHTGKPLKVEHVLEVILEAIH